jgi:penicillin-binding protein 1C
MRARYIFAVTALLAIGAGARDGFDAWVDSTALPNLRIETGVEVLDRNGDLLRAYTVADGRWRLRLTLAETDPAYIHGLVAYEDRRFYAHNGVDLQAGLRAGISALWQGRIVSGASTLSMQTARLLESSGTGNWAGKLRQVRLALALERRMSKEDILALYLNIAPFGGNIEGLRAAALAYFGKEPRRLTPAEIALLIALPQSPEARRPDRDPVAATAARNRVLGRLARDGLISEDAALAAQREAVPRARRAFPTLAPHLADRVAGQNLGTPQLRLTLDRSVQVMMESLARDSIRTLGDRVQIAILVADHHSGEILASVGSSNYMADARAGFVDMTQAIRSPGSTLKPLIYGLAFDAGLGHPETLIEDRPTDFNGYRPQNFDKQFRGMVQMRRALQLSLNIPVVALTAALEPEFVLSSLRNAGVKYALPQGKAGLAIGLGGIGVTLQDMVQLYAMIARGGISAELHSVQVGQTPQGQRVLSRASAWQLGDILAGLPPPAGAPRNHLAYKTGTSYGNRDAWAIGFDGTHVIGVWLGRPDGTPIPGALGADLAAPVLFSAFARIKPALAPLGEAPPETLLVASGQLPLPLQQFRPRGDAFDINPNGPKIIFPPDGAEVELLSQSLLLRLGGGKPPYTVLVDQQPQSTGLLDPAMVIEGLTAGFVTLTVIDASGISTRAHVRLRDP